MSGVSDDRTVWDNVAPLTRSKRERLPKPKFHRMLAVFDSDWIQAIQYDPDLYVLDATLLNGYRYRYREVGPELFALVITAKSVGSAFNELLKPRPFTRLPSQRK